MRQEEIWDAEAARRYDTPGTGMFDPDLLRHTVDHLAGLAGNGRALELAIGTGRVAIPLVERGVPVTGIELSEPMIDQLRRKVDETVIPVVVGDMATTRAPGDYTLVYLVFNTISNLLTQDEQVACFRNAARHLLPGGRFVIELGVPDLRALPPGQQAVVFTSEPGYIGLDTYDIVRQQHGFASFPVRREQESGAVPEPAPLHLAGRARPDGTARRIRTRVEDCGLGRDGVHRRIPLARDDLPADRRAVSSGWP